MWRWSGHVAPPSVTHLPTIRESKCTLNSVLGVELNQAYEVIAHFPPSFTHIMCSSSADNPWWRFPVSRHVQWLILGSVQVPACHSTQESHDSSSICASLQVYACLLIFSRLSTSPHSLSPPKYSFALKSQTMQILSVTVNTTRRSKMCIFVHLPQSLSYLSGSLLNKNGCCKCKILTD